MKAKWQEVEEWFGVAREIVAFVGHVMNLFVQWEIISRSLTS